MAEIKDMREDVGEDIKDIIERLAETGKLLNDEKYE